MRIRSILVACALVYCVSGLLACSGDVSGNSGGGGDGSGADGAAFADGGGGAGGDGGGSGWPVCASTTGEAQPVGGGVDIIWFIDTSGSMDEETAWVQQNLNDFATYIGGQQLDYRVILIGEEEICVPPPLGGPNCTDGPQYMHVPESVGSHDGLEVIIDTYDQWQGFLRAEATKNFVAVTDDNSDQPASWFDAELAQLTDPGFADGYIFHSIVAYGNDPETGCDTGAAIGQVYLDLSQQTGGVTFQICEQDWGAIFSNLAESVAKTAKPPCSYLIPDPGEGKEVNPKQIAVRHEEGGASTEIPKTASQDTCAPSGGWYFDDDANPTTVILCPDTCDAITGGKIVIDFGCLKDIE